MSNLATFTSACFLAREKRYIIECKSDDQQPFKACASTLLPMPNCDILGTKLLLSEKTGSVQFPFLVEYAEVDGGHFVLMNLHRMLRKLKQAIQDGEIIELAGSSTPLMYQVPTVITPADLKIELSYQHNRSHLLLLHPLFQADAHGVSYLPHQQHNWMLDALIDCLTYCHSGQKATIMFIACHTGIKTIEPQVLAAPEYLRLLGDALRSGLQLISAEIKLTPKLEFDFQINPLLIGQHRFFNKTASPGSTP